MSKPKRILRNQFIVPFGRFRINRPREWDNTPVLVGREGQRAFFVDALTGIGERGAFLITGRRGVGKTTFVESCLHDYRQNDFRRFLGSGVGRSAYDFILLTVVAFAVIGVLLAAGELLTFLTPALDSSPLLYIPTIACIVVAAAPLIIGYRALRSALSIVPEIGTSAASIFITLCAILVLAIAPPFGSPTQSISLVIFAIGILFFCGSLYMFRAPLTLGSVKHEFKRTEKRAMILISIVNIVAPLAVTVALTWAGYRLLSGYFLTPQVGQSANDDQLSKLYYLFLMVGTGLVQGSIFGQALAVRKIIVADRSTSESDHEIGRRLVRRTFILTAAVFFGFLAFGYSLNAATWIGAAMFFCVMALAALIVCGVRSYFYLGSLRSYKKLAKHRGKKPSKPRFFTPPVESVLVAKAFALILISMQLLYPVLAPLSGQEARATPEAWAKCQIQGDKKEKLPLRNGIPMFVVEWWPVDTTYKEPCGVDSGTNDQPVTYTLFDIASSEVRGWFIGVFFLIGLFFLVEYEWINRPFVNQRQPRAMARGPRRPQQAHHHLDPIWFEVSAARQFERAKQDNKELRSKTILDLYEPPVGKGKIQPKQSSDSLYSRRNALQRKTLRRFRTMENATFASVITGIWLPVLQVNVNLGFESLDHRGVTHAMLDGLRRAYRHTFVRIGTPYQVIRAFGMGFSVMILVVLLGRTWFDFPVASTFPDSVTWSKFEDIGEAWEDRQNVPLTWSGQVRFDATHPCHFLVVEGLVDKGESPGQAAFFPRLVCDLAPSGVAETIISFLYAELIPFELSAPYNEPGNDRVSDLPVFWFFHFNVGPPEEVRSPEKVGPPANIRPSDYEIPAKAEKWPLKQEPSLTFRVYHLLLLLFVAGVLERISRSYPILPYRKHLKRIESLLDELMLRRADTRSATTGLQISRLWAPLGDHETRTDVETSRDALDPRSVELKLLSLLTDLRSNQVSGIQKQGRLTIPRPDIHFIFDELDKLSGAVGAEYTSHQVDMQDRQKIDGERQRAYRLHRLLSDMKRVISSAPARFIFVGGRSLHDEWIRDQNRLGSTQPLLTSVFDHEIYLPSLLVDLPRARHDNALLPQEAQAGRSLDLRVREFLSNNYVSARELESELRSNRYLPWLGLGRMSTSARFFANHMVPQRERFALFDLIDARLGKFARVRKAELEELNGIWKREFFVTLIGFMAYRSAGSPKKMNELIGDMIRPSGSFLSPDIDGDAVVPTSRDALVIDDKLTYRAQFINSLFRHIEASFGEDLLQRDDKITINTIFIFDFLMKMHNRAFSWSSIERLDELAHIHRAPDLRRLFDSVITNSAERYFHRVLNGLYAFRFRSDLAIEIRYLSRISQAEMAALNFTLDESHELKTTFTAMLESAGDESPDLLTALGELYEFDQSYDIARGYYERALRSVDAEFCRTIGPRLDADDAVQDAVETVLDGRGHSPATPERLAVLASHRPGPDPEPFMMALLGGSEAAKKAVRLNLPWAIRRIRLMLQIGLTFEQQADEERAQAQYHAAQVFAGIVIDVAIRDTSQDPAPLATILKHLSLIFQPVFASAWTAEKLESGLDAGLLIAESQLRKLRRRIPELDLETETKGPEGDHAYALSFAELYNKAGDLYFFKGRAAYSAENFFAQFRSLRPYRKTSGQEGYLFRAHYNYATALHEVRRFNVQRVETSAERLHVAHGRTSDDFAEWYRWPTLDRKNPPTFLMQIAYSSLVDLAEAVLARTSLMEAWMELSIQKAEDVGRCFDEPWTLTTPKGGKSYAKVAYDKVKECLDNWFLWTDDLTEVPRDDNLEEILRDYLGTWAGKDSSEQVVFGGVGANHERILMSLVLSLNGARAVNRANYPDAASFESQITAEHVIRLLRTARTIMMSRKQATLHGNDNVMKERLQECHDHLEIGDSQLKFLSILIQIGVLAIKRIVEWKMLAYPEHKTKDELTQEETDQDDSSRYRTTDTSEIVAAALASEMRLLISNLSHFVKDDLKGDTSRADLKQYPKAWDAEMNALEAQVGKMLDQTLTTQVQYYQKNFTKAVSEPREVYHRRMSRAMLIYLVTHHKYPALTNLTSLKALIDDALAIDGSQLAYSVQSEVRDALKAAEKTYEDKLEKAKDSKDELQFAETNLGDAENHLETGKVDLASLKKHLKNLKGEDRGTGKGLFKTAKKCLKRARSTCAELDSQTNPPEPVDLSHHFVDLDEIRAQARAGLDGLRTRHWKAMRDGEASRARLDDARSTLKSMSDRTEAAQEARVDTSTKVDEATNALNSSAVGSEKSQQSLNLIEARADDFAAIADLVAALNDNVAAKLAVRKASIEAASCDLLVAQLELVLSEHDQSSAMEDSKRRLSESSVWLAELLDAEKLLDAPMHFPPSYMAETLSLMAILEMDMEGMENMARKYRWRAEQSFTMGRQYYQNLSRLVYLFDDFNDRRRHSIHAGQMAMADMLAFFRYILDRRS